MVSKWQKGCQIIDAIQILPPNNQWSFDYFGGLIWVSPKSNTQELHVRERRHINVYKWQAHCSLRYHTQTLNLHHEKCRRRSGLSIELSCLAWAETLHSHCIQVYEQDPSNCQSVQSKKEAILLVCAFPSPTQ